MCLADSSQAEFMRPRFWPHRRSCGESARRLCVNCDLTAAQWASSFRKECRMGRALSSSSHCGSNASTPHQGPPHNTWPWRMCSGQTSLDLLRTETRAKTQGGSRCFFVLTVWRPVWLYSTSRLYSEQVNVQPFAIVCLTLAAGISLWSPPIILRIKKDSGTEEMKKKWKKKKPFFINTVYKL